MTIPRKADEGKHEACGEGGREDKEGGGYCYNGEDNSEEGREEEKKREKKRRKKLFNHGNSRKRLGIKGRGFFYNVFGKKWAKTAMDVTTALGALSCVGGAYYLLRNKQWGRKGYYSANRNKRIRKLQKDLDEKAAKLI